MAGRQHEPGPRSRTSPRAGRRVDPPAAMGGDRLVAATAAVIVVMVAVAAVAVVRHSTPRSTITVGATGPGPGSAPDDGPGSDVSSAPTTTAAPTTDTAVATTVTTSTTAPATTVPPTTVPPTTVAPTSAVTTAPTTTSVKKVAPSFTVAPETGARHTQVMTSGVGCAGPMRGVSVAWRDSGGQEFGGSGGEALPDGSWQIPLEVPSAAPPGKVWLAASCVEGTGARVFDYQPQPFTNTG